MMDNVVGNMIGIRYQVPNGVIGVWQILRSAVPNDDEETLKAYLRHWHPEYVYLGRQDGKSALKPKDKETSL